MNRKEAIEELKNIKKVPSMFIDETIKELVEALESPLTLADLLGWKEGVEYEYYPAQNNEVTEKAKIVDNIFYVFISSADDFVKCPIYSEDIPNMTQAKKIEKKLKAYHVKDEYSYYCLMKEFEEQGYTWISNTEPTHVFHWDINENDTVIYCHENKKLTYSSLDGFNASRKDNYDLIEYKKEEPKFYAKIKGWELYSDNGICYYWKYYIEDELFASYKDESEHYKTKMTKTEWNKLGINDTNADFEKVED